MQSFVNPRLRTTKVLGFGMWGLCLTYIRLKQFGISEWIDLLVPGTIRILRWSSQSRF